jgi:nucleoside-diphosphate-sugar epimerase
VLNVEAMEGVALRYGFFYGPGTWYNPDGAAADQARKQVLAIIGAGEGVWSWVHIEDAAVATAAALAAPPGVIISWMTTPPRSAVGYVVRAVGRGPAPAPGDGTGGARTGRRGCRKLRHQAPRGDKREGKEDSELHAPSAAMVGPMKGCRGRGCQPEPVQG